jgi:hypothetical protein
VGGDLIDAASRDRRARMNRFRVVWCRHGLHPVQAIEICLIAEELDSRFGTSCRSALNVHRKVFRHWINKREGHPIIVDVECFGANTDAPSVSLATCCIEGNPHLLSLFCIGL